MLKNGECKSKIRAVAILDVGPIPTEYKEKAEDRCFPLTNSSDGRIASGAVRGYCSPRELVNRQKRTPGVSGSINGLSADSLCARGSEDGSQGAVACLGEKSDPEERLILEIGTVGHNNSCHWYAIRVRSQHEDSVARHLRVRGLESFLPLYKQQRRWSDRFKEIELPLFPGYVFCQFNPLNRLPVLTVPGVVHVVGTGKTPTRIEEEEIAAIQAAVKSGFPTHPSPFVEIGQRVRIEYGPLCGIEGILLGFRGHHRIVLSITLLQRSVAVEINEEWARPLSRRQEISRHPGSERHRGGSTPSHA